MRKLAIFQKDELPSLIVFGGINLLFFIYWLQSSYTVKALGIHQSTSFVNYLIYITIFFFSLVNFKKMSRRINANYKMWLMFYILYLLTMVIHNIGSLTFYNFLNSSVIFSLFILSINSFDEAFWVAIEKSILFHTFLATIFGIFIILTTTINNRYEGWTTDLILLPNIMYASSYLVITSTARPKSQKILAWVAFTVLFAVAIILQYRALIIRLVITILLFLFTVTKTKGFTRLFKTVVFSFIILLVAVQMYSLIFPSSTSLMNENINSTIDRFVGTEESLSSNNVRTEEGKVVIEQMSPIELIIGRGILGEWVIPNGEFDYTEAVRNYVHIGFVQLILKGGIILLILWLIFPYAISLAIFSKDRNPLFIGAAGIVLIQFISQIWNAPTDLGGMSYLFMFLCAGRILRLNAVRISSQKTSVPKPAIISTNLS
jgi:hypothetical protein